MDNRKIEVEVRLEQEEDVQKKIEEEKKDEKLNQKNMSKEDSKVKKKEKKSVKEKEKETKKEKKNKKRENQESLCDEKSIKKIDETEKNIQPKSKFLNLKRKEKEEREKERERQIKIEENKFGKNLILLKSELEKQDYDNSKSKDLIIIKPISVYVEEKKKYGMKINRSKIFK